MNAQEVLDMLYDEWQKTRNFTMMPGATARQQDRHTAIQCFSLLFTNSVWQFIVDRNLTVQIVLLNTRFQATQENFLYIKNGFLCQ